ncbi:MAG TPA: methionyl-tRNA formyltransferase [bacterium]|nr:methionyl-tRNA formyltransferase [bacterium]
MRIIFMGTPEFALPSLNRLLDAGHDVAAVVTVPDKPAGRGRHLRPSAVKECALRLNLPLLQPEELRAPDFIKDLRRLAADLFVVVAFRILPPEVFTLPGIGTINLHASLLPKYRGAAPINWAIINGEQETGATTFFIDEKVDTGQWLMQCRVPIGEEMSAGELHDLLAEEGGELLLRTVAGLEAGSLKPRPQEGEITRAPKLTREMALIDWRRPAREIHNLVRGLSPYPSAWTLWRGKTLKILKVRPGPAEAQEQPGTLINAGGRGPLLAATGEGTLELVTLQPEGGKALTAADFLRGHSLKPGEIIG